MSGVVLVKLNAGAAGERVWGSAHPTAKLPGVTVRLRRGSLAPIADVEILHHATDWRDVEFNDTVDVYLDGELVFTGFVGNPVETELGTDVLQRIECVGRRRVLYSERVSADKTYLAMDSGAIAKDVIDLETFTPALTTVGVDTTIGVTIASFTVTAGENVGRVLERLAKQDGAEFDVDETNDVTYAVPSATSQLTVTDADLVGSPRERERARGVSPPKNSVRIIGGEGYAAFTKQEAQDALYDLDSPTKHVAQRFVATTARLSAIAAYLSRTADPNKPGSMPVEIQTETNAATAFEAVGNLGSAYSLNSTAERVRQKFRADGHTLTEARFYISGHVGGANSYTIRVLDSTFTTVLASGAATVSGNDIFRAFSLTLTPGTLYYVELQITTFVSVMNGTLDTTTTYKFSGVDADLSTNSGGSWSSFGGGKQMALKLTATQRRPSGTRVEWSDDNTFTAGDVPYPPSWTGLKSWGSPKLALTLGTAYWFIFKASSDASGTKYWRVGYSTTEAHSSGSAVASTDSGTSWIALAYDLAFRLYWSAAQVDVTVEDATSIAAHGKWPYEETLSDVVDEETATRIANEILARSLEPGQRMRLPLDRLEPTLNLTQPVRVKRPRLDVDDDLDIAEIAHVAMPGRKARTTITVGTPEYNAARAVEELRQKVS